LQHAVTEAVPAVDVPDVIVDAVCTLRAALRRKELVASDRRWRQAVGLLQASAYLDGRPAVAETDLSVLTHVLWDSPAQRPTVEREVLQLVNPDAKEALDLADAIEELEAQLDAMAGQSREALSDWVIKKAHNQLAMAGKRLEKLREEAAAPAAPPPPSTGSPAASAPSAPAFSPRPSAWTRAWCRRSSEHGGDARRLLARRGRIRTVDETPGTLDELASRAGRWRSVSAAAPAPAEQHTGGGGRGPVRPVHLARHLRAVGRTARTGRGVEQRHDHTTDGS
jgi:hypothetical protein